MAQGTIISVTRREIELLVDGSIISGRTSTQALEVAVGDHVTFEMRDGLAFVGAVPSRKNLLQRRYRESMKILATNLDHVFIVSAAGPLFQPLFIDRVLTVCHHQGITASLVINKKDLGVDTLEPLLELYRSLGISVILCSAKYSQGLEGIERIVNISALRAIALTGISGVGKSTILNNLIPDAERFTREVSNKTGLGKQTTTQSRAFLYRHFERNTTLLLIDLPGVQNFGVGHLSAFEVANSFPELREIGRNCKYGDCLHRAESDCAVKEAVGDGRIATTRYESYVKMLEEIERAAPY